MAGQEILTIFSAEFQAEYARIMDPQFPQSDTANQLSVVRNLFTHFTSGLATLKNVMDSQGTKINAVEAEKELLKAQVQILGSVGGGAGKFKQSILDHKAIMNLKVLNSDKANFRMWNEKFVNAFEAAIKGSRIILETLMKGIDEGTIDDDPDTFELWYGSIIIGASGQTPQGVPELEYGNMNEMLNYVLIEKCEGDARTRIKTQKNGMGLLQYVEIYKWFTGTTGEGLSQKAIRIMTPKPPSSEDGIALALDRWCTQLEEVENMELRTSSQTSTKLRH